MGIDIAEQPAIVVEIDGGEMWRYGASGVDGLYVKGGITYSPDRYYFSFQDIQAVHDRISEEILLVRPLNGQHFRFLRKELSMTVHDFPGLDPSDLLSWEAGQQDAVEGAEVVIREAYASWRSGRRARAA